MDNKTREINLTIDVSYDIDDAVDINPQRVAHHAAAAARAAVEELLAKQPSAKHFAATGVVTTDNTRGG